MIELAPPLAVRPKMAWKTFTAPIFLLICSMSVQAGAVVQQAALAGFVAQPAAFADLSARDDNSETKAAASNGGSYRRALQQQQFNIYHTVQWYPHIGAQARHSQHQQHEQAPPQQQQQQQQLLQGMPGNASDENRLMVIKFQTQPVNLQAATSGYRPSRSVILACLVLSVLLGLMLLYYVLHRLFPHVFYMWQNDTDAGVSFNIVTDGIEVMAVGSAFVSKSKGIGVSRASLQKMPVAKYRNVCKHGLAQQLKQRHNADAASGTQTSPRCQRSADKQSAGAPYLIATAAAAGPVGAVGTSMQVARSSKYAAAAAATIAAAMAEASGTLDHSMMIGQCPPATSGVQEAALGTRHVLHDGVSKSCESMTILRQPAYPSGTISSDHNKPSTYDHLGWFTLGATAMSGPFSKRSSAGGRQSKHSSCGGRRSSGGQSAEDDDMCAICHEAYHSNDDVKLLPCSHFYHPDCIHAWLEAHDTCPLCKAQVVV